MYVTFVSLFPESFAVPLEVSVLGRAQRSGALRWDAVDPRAFATGVHRSVDDTPYGGGAGMILRAPEMAAAVEEARRRERGRPVLLMTPQGRPLHQRDLRGLARLSGMILVCARYEGVDQRFIDQHVDAEVSLGDFVLSGGELPALCVVDGVARLLPGVLGNAESLAEESHASEQLEYPHFTRPEEFGGERVPSVLLSGDHAKIRRWRHHASLLRTRARRPEWGGPAPLLHKRDQDDPGFDLPPCWVEPRHLPEADLPETWSAWLQAVVRRRAGTP